MTLVPVHCARLAYLAAILLTALAMTAPARAQPGSAVERDHPLLPRFAESTIIDYRQERDANYRLVLGNMRRSGGRVVPEQAQRLRGNLTRITYEIPQEFNGGDVMEFYRALADENGYTNLFSCNGRGCGNSNYWANNVFDNRTLYGPERNQYYMALRADIGENSTAYLVIYVITRTNRRLYAHLEILETAVAAVTPTPELSLDSLLELRSLRLTGVEFNDDDVLQDQSRLNEAAALLEQNPSLAVYIVSHLPGPGDLETLLQRSQRRAEQIRDLLLEQGVAADQVVARGVGPLAPLCSEGDCQDRVELVLQ